MARKKIFRFGPGPQARWPVLTYPDRSIVLVYCISPPISVVIYNIPVQASSYAIKIGIFLNVLIKNELSLTT